MAVRTQTRGGPTGGELTHQQSGWDRLFGAPFWGRSVDTTQYDPSYKPSKERDTLMRALQMTAEGTGGPSAAELQMRQGLDRNIAASRALAASQPGMSPAMAARQSQQAIGQMGAQSNQQAAMLRAQEQLGARQLMGSMITSREQQEAAERQRQLEAALAAQQTMAERKSGISDVFDL